MSISEELRALAAKAEQTEKGRGDSPSVTVDLHGSRADLRLTLSPPIASGGQPYYVLKIGNWPLEATFFLSLEQVQQLASLATEQVRRLEKPIQAPITEAAYAISLEDLI
jgi:hypothetical protein